MSKTTAPKVTMPAAKPVLIDEFKKHPDNPRRGDVPKLRELIRENGWVGVVYRQASTGYVLSGWHSSRAALEEGYTKLPTITLDVDDRRALKLLVSLNRGHEVGHSDEGDLSRVLRLLAEDDDLSGSGFDDDDTEAIMRASGDFGSDAASFLAGVTDEGVSEPGGTSTTTTPAAAPAPDDEGEPTPPATPAPDRPVYFQLGYTVTLDERDAVMGALKAMKARLGADSTSPQAIAAICREWTSQNGDQA